MPEKITQTTISINMDPSLQEVILNYAVYEYDLDRKILVGRQIKSISTESKACSLCKIYIGSGNPAYILKHV